MRKFVRSEQEGGQASKRFSECQKDLAQSEEKKEQLSIQYSSLSQKYYSEKRFTAQRPIWLLVRVPELLKDDNETTSLSLTEFECNSTRNKISLTYRPEQNVPESILPPEAFKIDHYFGPSSTNRDVYNKVEPLIDIVFHGCNVCIFADGQSGSSKSWTLFKGTDALVLSITSFVFVWNDVKVARGCKRDVKCSAIEIYQD